MKAVLSHVQRRVSDPAVVTLTVTLKPRDRDVLTSMLAASDGRLPVAVKRAPKRTKRRPAL